MFVRILSKQLLFIYINSYLIKIIGYYILAPLCLLFLFWYRYYVKKRLKQIILYLTWRRMLHVIYNFYCDEKKSISVDMSCKLNKIKFELGVLTFMILKFCWPIIYNMTKIFFSYIRDLFFIIFKLSLTFLRILSIVFFSFLKCLVI